MDGDFKIPFDSYMFESNYFLSLLESQPVFTCTKLTIETLEKGVKYVNIYCHWRRSGVFIVNFEFSHLLVFLLLTLNI